MRLFIAINFNNDTCSRLLALRDKLREHSRYGNFSHRENLHLTLAFLGECNAKQHTDVKSVFDAITFDPFKIIIDHAGRFKRGGGDIWWAGVRDNPALTKLQGKLSERLRLIGFMLEDRKYSPHITLGREVITDYAFDKIEPFGEIVNTVDLMKSERIGGKLVYTKLYNTSTDSHRSVGV